jgi:hypothetical protein
MKRSLFARLSIICILLVLLLPDFCSGQRYDTALMKPDIDAAGMQHGFNLTPLGCLLYTPLTCAELNEVYNVATFYQGKEISSVGVPYTDLQKEIVFEFQRNGTLKYWLKKDYLKPAIDTLTDASGGKYVLHTIRPSTELKLRRMYDAGKWQVNFSDSSILIDFGNNDLGLVPLKGKYTSLGAGRMSLRQTFPFDSLTNGKMESYIRNINTYFESY